MLRLKERRGLLWGLRLLLLLHKAKRICGGVLGHNESSGLRLHLRLRERLGHPERGTSHHRHLLLSEWIVLSMLLEVGGGWAGISMLEHVTRVEATDAPVGLWVEHVLLLTLNGREEVDHVLRRLGT